MLIGGSLARTDESWPAGEGVFQDQFGALAAQRRYPLAWKFDESPRCHRGCIPPGPGPWWQTSPPDPPHEAPARGFLDTLDRQLDAAARRLAARTQAGAGRSKQ